MSKPTHTLDDLPQGRLDSVTEPLAADDPRGPAMAIRGPVLACLTDHFRTSFFPTRELKALVEVAPELTIEPPTESEGEFARRLEELQPEVVISCWRTPRFPTRPPTSVRYLCHLCGSVRYLVTRQHIEAGLLVTNWGDSISRTVAEAALMHVIGALRDFGRFSLAMRHEGYWRTDRIEGRSLFGRRVGLHGFGNVARALLPLLRPFGVEVRIHAPDADRAAGAAHGFIPVDSLDGLFGESDIVIELAPLIPETEGSIDERLLRLLPREGVFINVGRGGVVDEDALVRVAAEGHLRVGLDVFAEEPLCADHPLRFMPNVVLTPHTAGPTADRCRDSGAFALANLRSYAAGRPLRAMITPELYDVST